MGIVCASFEADVNVVVDMSAVLPDAIVPNGGWSGLYQQTRVTRLRPGAVDKSVKRLSACLGH